MGTSVPLQELRSKCFGNSPEGWGELMAWLKEQNIKQVHACLEATGRYSLGVALALCEAGHIVSIVNPAQIRDFARTKLGRNKTDGLDAGYIREYAAILIAAVRRSARLSRSAYGTPLPARGQRTKQTFAA